MLENELFFSYSVYYMLNFIAANNSSSVTMTEGDEMDVIEQDQGDGWTRVKRKDGSEGFVPTSYIQCHFYDQDEV